MRPFTFKLEGVLRQRHRTEQTHQQRVALIQRERMGVIEALETIRRELDLERGDLRQRLGSPHGKLSEARAQLLAISAMQQRQARAHATLEEIEARLASAQRELARAAGERRAVELLRDRRYEAWRREGARQEQRALDDLTTRAWAHKGST